MNMGCSNQMLTATTAAACAGQEVTSCTPPRALQPECILAKHPKNPAHICLTNTLAVQVRAYAGRSSLET